MLARVLDRDEIRSIADLCLIPVIGKTWPWTGRDVRPRDDSGVKGPEQWAREAVDIYTATGAYSIVCETASLRDFVIPLFRRVLRTGEPMPRLVPAEPHGVNKYGRASAISSLVNADPARCFFCDVFPGLETQMTGFTGTSRASPDRLDAFVWGLPYLSQMGKPKYGGTGPNDYAIR